MTVFSLQSALLRNRFQPVRLCLVGEKPLAVPVVPPATVRTSRFQLPKIKIKVTLPKVVLPQPSRKVLRAILAVMTAASVLTAAVLFTPDLYYRVFPADTEPVIAKEAGTPLGGNFTEGTQATIPLTQEAMLPPQDPTLPDGTWLIIPRIGVRTQPQATVTEEEALQTGVWLVPDYGRPGDRSQPIIMAAHRFGWQWWWQTDYWQYHSFYKLPELEPGDVVEVIHDQRKFYYEIYAGEEGEEITDYGADLILYTCKFLNSPLRHFRYARQIDFMKDSQS